MSEKHTQGRLKAVVRDLMLEGGRFRMASNITPCGSSGGMQDDIPTAMANARRLAACWNACAGFDNELLENIDLMGDTLKQRFEGMQAEVRRVDSNARAIEANYEVARTLLKDVMDDVPANYSDPLTRRIRAFLKGQP